MKKFLLILFFFSFFLAFAQNKTESYITKYSSSAIVEMEIYGIPASITLAQGILESGSGESRLAVDGNNHFGIKCHSNWNGKTIIEDDDDKGECFRKYSKVSESYRDHSLFLTQRGRYSFLFEYNKTDYKKWAKGLKKAGYATNPKYSTLLIDLIEKYDLTRFDNVTKSKKNLYFAHSYGLPYLTGLGAYYFNKNALCFTEVNTSFSFSDFSIGYHYNLIKKIYVGAKVGGLYIPTEEVSIKPYLSPEFMIKRDKNKSILIRGGVQCLLVETQWLCEELKILPYVTFTYLLD